MTEKKSFWKRFSFHNIKHGLEVTVRRFPVVVLVSLAGTYFAIAFIYNPETSWTWRGLLAMVLGLFLTFAVAIAAEHSSKKMQTNVLGNVLALLLMGGFYLYLPHKEMMWRDMDIARTIMWIASVFLIMFVAPFVWKRGANVLSFWKYALSLIGSFVLTAVFTALFWAGVSAALSSVDVLFSVIIRGELYPSALALIMGIFATLFFLSRAPTKEELSVGDTVAYLKELKIFSYFVLFPLTVGYFVILYVYAATNLSFSEWPEALISYMVIGFSVVGMVTHIFLYPLIKKQEWVKWAVRFLYIAIIPQVAVLFWSVGVRINAFGWTENRYFVVLFGLWLLGCSLYFLIGKKKQLLVLPMSVVLLVLLSTFGPWSAFSVGEVSQLNRFEEIAIDAGLLVDGKVVEAPKGIEQDVQNNLGSIVDYLVTSHGISVLEPYTDADLSEAAEAYRYERVGLVVHTLFGPHFTYQEAYYSPWDSNYFGYYVDEYESGEVVSVAGYDYMIGFMFYNGIRTPGLSVEDKQFEVLNNMTQERITLKNVTTKQEYDLDLSALLASLNEKFPTDVRSRGITHADMSVVYEDESVRMMAVFNDISGQKKGSEYTLDNLSGSLFFVVK